MADPIRAALERLVEAAERVADVDPIAALDLAAALADLDAARAALAAAPEATAEESSVPAPAVPALPPGYEAIGPEWQPDALARARATLAAWNALATAPKTGPSESDITELFYRHMGEGSEVGFENAIAEALARWGCQPAPLAEGEDYQERPTAQSVAMTDLSPAAQAVLAAAHGCWHQAGTSQQGLAAALRAVADQDETLFDVEDELPAVRAVRTDRLLAIAAELERRP